jgi:hypothetical protein
MIRIIKPRRIRYAGHVARIRQKWNAYGVFMGKPDGKRQLGRLRRRWEYNIIMEFREIAGNGMVWINLARDRDQLWVIVNTAMKPRNP